MVGTGSGPPASSSWRTPSEADRAKYHLVPLPEDFQPTREEEDLLAMYETVRSYEKEAARLKEEAARAKLEAKNAEFKQSKEAAATNSAAKPAKKAKAKKPKQAFASPRDDDDDENSYDDDSEDDAQGSKVARGEAKLAAMREHLKDAMLSEEAEEEALRAQHLATNMDDDDGPLLKRKRMEDAEPSSSLIANLENMSTPPHDFSKTLEIKPWHGKILFPSSPATPIWTPPPKAINFMQGAFSATLEDFDVAQAQHGPGNNTVAIKFHVPHESKRFSINIALSDHSDFHNVLFHFNPRQHERGGQVIINDKQDGQWGQAIAVPLSQWPLIFGQTACTLLIQIHGDGFDMFLEGKHCARMEHRRALSTQKMSLVLQFPSTDDYGSPENWMVYKVWWGNKPLMAKGNLAGVAGVNMSSTPHPRKIFIKGLEKISTSQEIEIRRAELERAFRKYGGDRGVTVIVPVNQSYAFVEVETERLADLALQEMADQYRVFRARRTRQEALQEERAAAEAAKRGDKKEAQEWD